MAPVETHSDLFLSHLFSLSHILYSSIIILFLLFKKKKEKQYFAIGVQEEGIKVDEYISFHAGQSCHVVIRLIT